MSAAFATAGGEPATFAAVDQPAVGPRVPAPAADVPAGERRRPGSADVAPEGLAVLPAPAAVPAIAARMRHP